ncbi:MAG: hypothetical protein E3J93_00365 [Dehalococcoidia bacterium]|nr:MAG: hypothetical protein E3J93_00365 [Dehalococcoidia bacterium]
MFGKNRNKKVGLCLMVVTSCFILAGLWAVLATPETALAKKPTDPGGGGGGGGKEKVPTCVKFDGGGSVVGDQGNTIYCHNKKEKITVEFSNALSFGGRLHLQTNSTDKANVGRGLFIDFGTPVTLAPGTPNEMPIQTTDEALFDIHGRVLGVSANLRVGAHQEFDFFNMVENPNSNVNLRIRVLFYFTDGSRDSLLIRLDPDGTGRTCPSSDPVTVTFLGEQGGKNMWRVETQEMVVKGACLSRSNECEDGDTDSGGEGCLLDVNTPGLEEPDGHIALNFGFIVTAAP